jgi:hypothetical protein
MSNLVIPDGGNIGSASDTDAISIPANGKPTFSAGIANTGTIDAGTIGSNVTITDGASPHGWEHIKTISYSADTATSFDGTTATKMNNVVSSKYTAYKLIIHWGAVTNGSDIYFRFLDTSNNAVDAGQYYYGYHMMTHTNAPGGVFNGTGSSYAQIGNDIAGGSIGYNCEMLLYNCFASSSDYPQVDGHTLTATSDDPARPQAIYRQTGYDNGDYYQVGYGSINMNVITYVTGFLLTYNGDASVEKDSWWSCYGLKLPTAD